MRAPKNLREGVTDLTQASDDGTEYEHNDGCQGEPDCPACWVEGIRRLFADFPDEGASRAIYEAAQALDTSESIAAIIEEAADELDPPVISDWLQIRDWFKGQLHTLAAQAREAGGWR